MNNVLRLWSVSRPAQTQEVPSLAFVKAIDPRGASRRIRVITGTEPASAARPSDVIIFAPPEPFHPHDRTFEAVVGDTIAAMAPEAVLYVVAPRHLRRKALHLLRSHGLKIGAPTVHLRSGAARYYIPLTPRCLRFAVDSWPLPRRWRFCSHLLTAFPALGWILGLLLPTVGFAASTSNKAPFSWLRSRLHGSAAEALVATSWRQTEASALVFGFAENDTVPELVAKQAPPSKRSSAYHEADMLAQVAPFAQQAGVRVPRLMELLDKWGQTYVLETGVSGRPLSRLLASRPAELSSVVHKLSAWLEAWHQNSVQRAPLTSADCEEMILGPARALADGLLFGSAYLGWLEEASTQLIGTEVPWVHTHNDLTMANVLQDDEGRISVVDWEVARPRGLPLADFWYSACDAATACGSHDRATMFNNCFLQGGTLNTLVDPHDRRLRDIVGGPPEWFELCFHACWLQHAVNERNEAVVDESSPFLAIVNALAQSALDYERPENRMERRQGSPSTKGKNARNRRR